MKKKKRLLWQLYPSYLLITLISLLAVSLFASSAFREFFLERTAADLKSRAHLLEEQVGNYIVSLNGMSVDSICKSAGRQSSTRITVILSSGKVVGDSEEVPENMDNHANRFEVSEALRGEVGTSIRYSKTLKHEMMYVAIPLKRNNNILGVLRTSIPVTSIYDELQSIQIQIAFGGLLIALFAAGVSLFISKRISKPIEEIKKGAERFARGDLNYRMPVSDTEEIRGLAEAMNQMAIQLDDRIKTVIKQRNELEAVLSSMKEGVIAVDLDEIIISINQSAASMFKSSASDLEQRSIQEAIRNPDLQKIVKSALSNGEHSQGDIVLYQGEESILNVQTTSLLDENEKFIGILIVLNDVTQLRHLETMRKEFVSNVSHEIKTPLTAIKGFVETLSHGAIDNSEEAKRFLKIIQKHVNRLVALIEDLMHLSVIEQKDKTKEIKLIKGNIRSVIKTAVQVCQAKAESKKIKVNLICQEDVSTRIDPPLLEQAAVNLLDNAIKYSEEGGLVQIEAITTESEICISFKDYGIGIPKEHLPRLFERFYRVDKARSRKLGGTGLGLAIVKHIIQTHGGYVTVESEPEEGSNFIIHLPKA
ncbi:MAG: cell wall metabolism sensor histidine kinase WalK [Proteobacteria bacterium]|nr:cell wall metabolism sensor histidine kinase WalK [Pseudomonadota bacterium]MBU4287784.1 cell wall metabolism sensor histidine kinase WalK [Pseudomonadota bacterium]MBU4413794.1 cell wall metabolism sensor histidine kinase WalK [Pseudomonadota bacterium]MCG2830352.1 cell wall metabolism sensor histidine kinase WalK [Desulfobacteraceae bacterium]